MINKKIIITELRRIIKEENNSDFPPRAYEIAKDIINNIDVIYEPYKNVVRDYDIKKYDVSFEFDSLVGDSDFMSKLTIYEDKSNANKIFEFLVFNKLERYTSYGDFFHSDKLKTILYYENNKLVFKTNNNTDYDKNNPITTIFYTLSEYRWEDIQEDFLFFIDEPKDDY